MTHLIEILFCEIVATKLVMKLLEIIRRNGVKPTGFLKKNLNAPRPSEHPPVRGKKCQNV